MNALNNYVQLIGHLGSNPELKEAKNGSPYLLISLATNDNYVNSSGDWESKTQWHRLIAWGKMAQKLSENCEKGDQIIVRGKLEHHQYEDDQKKPHYVTQVVVSNYLPMKKRNTIPV